jgi:hypothetical protein
MWNLMKPVCKRVEIDPGTVAGMSGIVATGEARVEHGFGHVCRAGMVPLTSGGSSQVFAVVGHFKNESLNDHLMATARIEYVGLQPKV